MSTRDERPEFVLGVSPAGQSCARLCAAVAAAGGLGVLDLGAGGRRARAALARTARERPSAADRRFGLRVPEGCALSYAEVAAILGDAADRVDVVVLGWDSPWSVAEVPDRYFVLVEVTSPAEAAVAAESGADGLLARGAESGGRVSETGAFVLLQHLVAATRLPVWLAGGIGPDTAAAAVVGGAAGVVLDTQLALLADTDIPGELAAAIAACDGTGSTGSTGKDAFLATGFRDRYGTAARAVRGVLNAIGAAVHTERPPVLAAGSALASALGTRYPIAQGPMTRVSDTPEFAGAVADGGGLPLLALALSPAPRCAELMAETAALLGDRPWGVGLLGFAPPELRAAQVAAVLAARPPVALIAGGRPDQASALEAEGITTFLHVPSPGLLRQFLDAGARRFVFEGSECGGHVGPRTSFALWQAQLDVLGDCPHAGETQILFAGGVHDARSAAMVAALAGPLADRGAAVGVLMGTAYLFTEEAVAAGAITPAFQRRVVDAEGTELLHTAPGHATRCVASPYTAFFAETAARLRADGVPEREAWARLEELNVGRLRVASKGLRRDGAALVAVDADGQHADGLFMAGQVSALRSAVTTIADLHREVADGAAGHLRERAARVRGGLPGTRPPRPRPAPADIAIVGMACVYPGAPDLAAFWANVVGNRDSVTEVPDSRWDTGRFHGDGDGQSRSKWGGFLDPVPFDPLRYGIPPAALGAIEPVQLLALEMARRALEDAGYGDGGFDRERAGVVFGAEAGSDLAKAQDLRMFLPAYAESVPDELMARLPALTGDSFPGRLVNIIAGRVANRLDLGGANYVVDAACGSSLAAVDAACKELAVGGADLMLAGGADLHNAIGDFLLFSSVGALSPTGRCRTFDGSADGIALGEGVACVVLKRLADAEHDGDRVYAVIKGVGTGSDGRALGLTAPREEGQRRALERAYAQAGVSPSRVGLVEAHGTGTVLGDRTELATLTEVYSSAGAAPGSVGLGSVKSQIGHTKCAAGLAGLIKAAMAVHTGVRPPTLHVTEPNPAWDAGTSPFAFRSSAAPWPGEPASRVAAVSAFGFGGTNFHVVLSGHSRARRGLVEWPAELFVFRGETEDEAAAGMRSVLELVGALPLRDLARTAAARADGDPAPARVAVVAADQDALARLLARALAGDSDPEAGLYRASGEAGKLAVLFPGQGSQRPGMLAELFVAFPDLLGQVDPDVLAALFPAEAFTEEGRRAAADRLRDTAMAQPALGVTGLAVHEVLSRLGLRPDMYGGHSYGELVALAAAGAIDPGDLLPLSAARAAAILSAAGEDPGAMAAVTADYAAVRAVLDESRLAGRVVVANHNAPAQVVLSGPTTLLAEAVAALRAAGLSVRELPVACAFHSPVVAAAARSFADELALCRVEPPSVPVWANRTARPYVSDVEGIRAELAAQVASPVLFAAQIENMYADGARVFVEAGPGRVLSNLVAAVLGDRPHTVVSCEPAGAGGLTGLLHAVAALAVSGSRVRLSWLTSGRGTEVSTPATPGWTVDGHLVRTADGSPVDGGLTPARRVRAVACDRDSAVADFLRTTRELVVAQRDVLLGYLGAAHQPVPVARASELAPPGRSTQDILPTPVDPVAAPARVAEAVNAVIAERTGYPVGMIEPDLDLEADLSVDSIKRTEIVGELVSRLGSAVPVDDLVRARTAAALARLLDGGGTPDTARVVAPSRRVVVPVPAPVAPSEDPGVLFGATILLAGGTPTAAEALAGRLSAHGALAVPLPSVAGLPDWAERVDGLVCLPSEEPLLPGGFALARSVLARRPRWLLAVEHADRALGLAGFLRTVRREHPETAARLVELPEVPDDEGLADIVVSELTDTGTEPVVTIGQTRTAPAVEAAPLSPAVALDLGSDSVVLLVGGARGITARVAVALAASGGTLELAGRTPPPTGPEDPATASAADLTALRGVLAGRGTTPAEADRAAKALLASREVAATLAAIRAAGATATHRRVDACDPHAVRRLVKQVHAEHGRIDGVVFAAGVIEDRLIADKDPESFRRVYATKVDGMAALLGGLDDAAATPRFVVAFGSIAAVLGSRGQADYAAANSAVDTLTALWARRTGNRALTVHWGPWSPEAGGMVTTELSRVYAERGIELIDPDAGVAALLAEIATGTATSVLYAGEGW